MHCIGDRANKAVLDIFEDVLKGQNATKLRPRIEHSQIMTAEDVVRAGRLGGVPIYLGFFVSISSWAASYF